VSPSSEGPLGPAQLATLDQLAAVLTPGGGGLPDAADADRDGEVLQLALRHLARDLDALRAVLDQAADADPAAFLGDLADRSPEQFEVLRRLLVCRYLTCRPVWDVLGYGGRRPSPPAAGEAEGFLSDGILDAVIARGPRYLPTPPESRHPADERLRP
jgi:hypothetical protein